MTKQRKTYTREFKLKAIRLWQTTDKSAREVEDDLGIARGLLYRWKGQLVAKGEDAFTGKGVRCTLRVQTGIDPGRQSLVNGLVVASRRAKQFGYSVARQFAQTSP